MKIDILCTDGSPLGVTSRMIWGSDNRIGVGGSELALLTMCEEWTRTGHDVTLYNDPYEPGASAFEQRNINTFDPSGTRDVLIIFRTPNYIVNKANGLRVWWSTDQYTSVPFTGFDKMVDKVVCISPFHVRYFRDTYGMDSAIYIDLPVRIRDFDDVHDVERIKHRVIYTSVPGRGLNNLNRIWVRIKKEYPDASLVITSDYRLWGAKHAYTEPYVAAWLNVDGASFRGAIPRRSYIREVLSAQVLLYPCIYDELFCISVAEAQVAGVFTITSGAGALPTTNMGKVIDVDANDPFNDLLFIEAVADAFDNPKDLSSAARERFSPDRILKEWDEKVFA